MLVVLFTDCIGHRLWYSLPSLSNRAQCRISRFPAKLPLRKGDTVAVVQHTQLGAGEDARIERALGEFTSLLVQGETIDAYAVQRRLFALKHRRALVCATTGRFMGMTRGLFGGFHPEVVRWQDIKEVRINVGIFGADLTIVALATPDLAVTGMTRAIGYVGLRKDQAEAVYRICQAQEQAWREKRRVRELEELRAKSGGIQLGASAGLGGGTGTVSGGTDGAAARLQQAKEMFDKGLISDSEYESLKARIVSSL